MFSVTALAQFLPPPTTPSETPVDGDWRSVEARIGIEFPSDYKEFISRYGTGSIDSFLWVLNPFSANTHLNLFNKGSLTIQSLRELRHESIPYPLYDKSIGLIPWCITDNGDVIYWLCSGAPSTWIIVVNESRGPRWREYNLSTIAFLTKTLTRELVIDLFPDDFPSDSPEFISAE